MDDNSKEILLRDYYLTYYDMVFRIALIYMGHIEDAKDITQEVFIRLLKQGSQFSDDVHTKSWLIKVTKNICHDAHRSKWYKRKSLADIEERFYQDDVQNFEIMESIINLKEKYKLIIILYYYNGYKIREIAQLLNKKESTIKMQLKRAKELLKVELEESV